MLKPGDTLKARNKLKAGDSTGGDRHCYHMPAISSPLLMHSRDTVVLRFEDRHSCGDSGFSAHHMTDADCSGRDEAAARAYADGSDSMRVVSRLSYMTECCCADIW